MIIFKVRVHVKVHVHFFHVHFFILFIGTFQALYALDETKPLGFCHRHLKVQVGMDGKRKRIRGRIHPGRDMSTIVLSQRLLPLLFPQLEILYNSIEKIGGTIAMPLGSNQGT